MKREVFIKEEAVAETVDAFNYYESEKKGLGWEFVDDLESYYERIADNPHLYQADQNGRRIAVMKRFPYKIVYEIEATNVVVFAVFHTSRKPQ